MSAPTTDSEIAAEHARRPARGPRRRPGTTSRCSGAAARNSGRKQAQTSSGERRRVDRPSAPWRRAAGRRTATSSSPPHWTNVEMVSTSLVTRETSEPRRSVVWVSTDRSCTCRKAFVRSVASPRLGGPEEPQVGDVGRDAGDGDGGARRTSDQRSHEAGPRAARRRGCRGRGSAGPRSAPPPGRRWRSGRAASVTPMPRVSSGESSRPRRSVAHALRAAGRAEHVHGGLVAVAGSCRSRHADHLAGGRRRRPTQPPRSAVLACVGGDQPPVALVGDRAARSCGPRSTTRPCST